MGGLHGTRWLGYVFFWLLLAIPPAGASRLSATEPAAQGVAHRRAAVEQQLKVPLEWQEEIRDHVTLAELLAHLEQHHQLSIRWDIGALRPILDGKSWAGQLAAASAPRQASYLGVTSPMVTSCVTCLPANVVSTEDVPPSYPTVPPHGAAPVYNGGPAVPAPLQPSPAPAWGSPSPTPFPVPINPQSPQYVPELEVPPSFSPPRESTVSQEVPPPPHAPEGMEMESGVEMVRTHIETLLHLPVPTTFVALRGVSVEEGLRQLLDAVSPAGSVNLIAVGLPLSTRAFDLDLLADDHSLIITTKLRANSARETRVYRIGGLADTSPEQLTQVITHTVRPWSWRGQTMEIAERLAARWPKQAAPISLASIQSGGVVSSAVPSLAVPSLAVPEFSEESVAALGQLLAGGAEAAVHCVVAALEIAHHGDPPTGSIESIPGFLIITQSQGAHREIRELLEQLAAAD